jgi:hypothetical protein
MIQNDMRYERLANRLNVPENVLQRALELNEGLMLLNSIQIEPLESKQSRQPADKQQQISIQQNPAEVMSLDSYREAIRQAYEEGINYDTPAA